MRLSRSRLAKFSNFNLASRLASQSFNLASRLASQNIISSRISPRLASQTRFFPNTFIRSRGSFLSWFLFLVIHFIIKLTNKNPF